MYWWVLVALVLRSVSSASAQPAPRAVGAGFDVTRYEVRLTPDFASRSVAGRTRIVARSTTSGLTSVSFSPNALEIVSASMNGRPVGVRRSEQALTFDLPHSVPRGRAFTLDVEYAGRPRRGVTFGERSVFTGYFACDWMICLQDAPGDKAVFSLDLRLPAGLRSIGPGRLASSRRLEGGEVVHSWREERPYSPYLYGFAAGSFTEAGDTVGGVRLRYLGEGASASRLEQLFAPTPAMVAFFEDRAGLRLPGGRYVQLLTPGAEAQEAAGFSLVGRTMIEPILADPKEDWVIAHELAHQWWGNLVTCKDWSHFWLNEGVTTFMVAAWKEHRWGRAAYDREMDLARRRLAAAERAGFDVPLTYAGEYPSLAVRRAVQYSKGALFLDALRTEMGERPFWDGLRRFTRAHAGGVVDSRDFQRAMQRSSGRDLGPLFDRWVHGTSGAGTTAAPASPLPRGAAFR